MVAVYGLIDFEEPKKLFAIKKVDGMTWVITFVATLSLGIEKGILIGAAFSLLVFIWRSANPHVAELGFVENEAIYKNILRYPEAVTDGEVLLYRIDSSLFFANMSFLEKKLCDAASKKDRLKWIVLDFSAVNSIDAIALYAFVDLVESFSKQGIIVLVAGMKGPVKDVFEKAKMKHGFSNECEINYLSIDHALMKIGRQGVAYGRT